MNLRVLPEAAAEMTDAARYYEARRAGLGQEFLDCVQDAIFALIARPLAFPRYEGMPLGRYFRRVPVARFPYLVVYEVRVDEVVVVAVPHTSREPGYWALRGE
jgi:plasmid stabilization system protein ParE